VEELLLNLWVLVVLYGDFAATIDLWLLLVTVAVMWPAQQGNV
jgi:hypothetical protein